MTTNIAAYLKRYLSTISWSNGLIHSSLLVLFHPNTIIIIAPTHISLNNPSVIHIIIKITTGSCHLSFLITYARKRTKLKSKGKTYCYHKIDSILLALFYSPCSIEFFFLLSWYRHLFSLSIYLSFFFISLFCPFLASFLLQFISPFAVRCVPVCGSCLSN